MKISVLKNSKEVGRAAAGIIAAQIMKKKNSVIGLATGDTVIPVYKELVRMYENGELNFSRVKTFNLDEYYGLSSDNPESYRYFMDKNLFSRINIKEGNINFLKGKPFRKMCEIYESRVRKMGLDLQILGIGRNGHIGFNEPGSSFRSRTRMVELTSSTIKANSRFFKSRREVPGKAFTMGISTILTAKRILLLAFGKDKANAIKRALNGPMTKDFPASVLQNRDNVTVLIDKEAASKMRVVL